MCKSKKRWGLGITRILDKNKSLLAQLIWPFGKEENMLWKRLMCAKYGIPVTELGWDWLSSLQSSVLVKSVLFLFEEGSKTTNILNDGLQELTQWNCFLSFLDCIPIYSTGMSWWNVLSCPSKTMKDWLWGWSGLCSRTNNGRAWGTLFFVIVWTVWETRNNLIFKGTQPNLAQSIDLVKFRVVCWFKHHGKGLEEPITMLLLNLKERCVDPVHIKKRKKEAWTPPARDVLKFNVDSSARRCS
ncbi:hypothetical protein Dsin_028518 [Dipteronia sinensis]|uniref:Uncharacterized protein n=1 Tax=Dipteronia sinensis TaxID=43782 RepID=A0AAD9ZQZ8_9ROSI|nr:hypothetical protein Dsin_028518 [Dipteronia sinensis]